MARKKKTQSIPERPKRPKHRKPTNTPYIPDTLNETTAGDYVEEQRDIESDSTMVTEELPDEGTDMEEILPSTPVLRNQQQLVAKVPLITRNCTLMPKRGVTKDTQPNLVTEAILYQNPYYKQ